MAWENNVLGFVPKKDLLDVGFNVTRQDDPVDQLFGDIKTDNLMAEWESIAAQYQIPMMAQFHGFDTESQKTFRVPIDVHNIEKGLIKVKINQSERMRALIGRGVVRESALYDYVINDSVNLAEQVFTRSKVAKNEVLATGKVTIKENNLDLTVDYGVPANHLNLTLDFGAGAAKDIPSQIEDIVSGAKSNGVIINGIYTANAVVNKLRRNIDIQKAIYGNEGAGRLVKRADLNTYLNDEFGINTLITNDLTYGKSATFGADGRPQITQSRYYPEDKITFFATNPGGRLGEGLWGDPPEVDVAKYIDLSAEPTVSPFVVVSQWTEKDPAVLWTKASALFMPVLFNPESIYVASVTNTAATTETTEGDGSGV